jgi:hypothetical protein
MADGNRLSPQSTGQPLLRRVLCYQDGVTGSKDRDCGRISPSFSHPTILVGRRLV